MDAFLVQGSFGKHDFLRANVLDDTILGGTAVPCRLRGSLLDDDWPTCLLFCCRDVGGDGETAVPRKWVPLSKINCKAKLADPAPLYSMRSAIFHSDFFSYLPFLSLDKLREHHVYCYMTCYFSAGLGIDSTSTALLFSKSMYGNLATVTRTSF